MKEDDQWRGRSQAALTVSGQRAPERVIGFHEARHGLSGELHCWAVGCAYTLVALGLVAASHAHVVGPRNWIWVEFKWEVG